MSVRDRLVEDHNRQAGFDQLHLEHQPFLFNAWYIAAEVSELEGDTIVGRTLLGKRIAIYRGASGRKNPRACRQLR